MSYIKLLIILFLLHASLFANINLTTQEKEFIKNHPVITLGGGKSFAPFVIQNQNGTVSGYDVDIAKLIKERTGLNIEFKLGNWVEIQKIAYNRELDGLSSSSRHGDRYKYYNPSNTYFQYTPLVIINKGNPKNIYNLKDLENKTIAVQQGNITFTKIANSFNNVNIKYYETMHDLIRAVVSKEVDFTIIDETAFYIAKEIGLEPFIEHSFSVGNTVDMVFSLRNDYPELINIVNKGLNAISEQEYRAARNKWIDIDSNKQIDYDFIFKILGGILVVILFVLYRQSILNKANSKLEYLVQEKTEEITQVNKNLELRVIEEVSKSKKMEKKLFEVEKLASMGEMIGNIAHQWKQPLNVISVAAGSMRISKELDELSDSEFIETCEIIDKNTQYLSKTIDDFGKYIKGDRKQTLFSLQNELDSVRYLVESSLKIYNISLVMDLEPNIEIYGYENELTQCMINIINNAKDALVEREDENRYIFLSAFKEESGIIISVKDSAGGIAESIIDKVFEPYFTTKHKSQGTGLGLHMTYDLIVHGMGGSIEVENVGYKYNGLEFKGAKFIITLVSQE